MVGSARRFSRRSFLIAGLAGTRLAAQSLKGTTFPSDWRRYSDPTTEMEVYRLTDPAYSSTLPAYYNRAIARSGERVDAVLLRPRRISSGLPHEFEERRDAAVDRGRGSGRRVAHTSAG